MYDFKKHILRDETILWEGRPCVGKASKEVNGELIVIVLMTLIEFAMIWSVATGTGDGANGINFSFIIIFLVTLLFSGLCAYSVIYKLFLKDKEISDDFYCLTNKRVFKYEARKNELICGYLINYPDIKVELEKKGYGDLYMGVLLQETSNGKSEREHLRKAIFSKDKNNMHSMRFESIDNVQSVLKMVENARRDLLRNNEKLTLPGIRMF